MKKKISAILFGLLFLVGFGILVYPTVSNQWNTFLSFNIVVQYNAYSVRTAHPFRRNGAPFRFKLSKAQQVD